MSVDFFRMPLQTHQKKIAFPALLAKMPSFVWYERQSFRGGKNLGGKIQRKFPVVGSLTRWEESWWWRFESSSVPLWHWTHFWPNMWGTQSLRQGQGLQRIQRKFLLVALNPLLAFSLMFSNRPGFVCSPSFLNRRKSYHPSVWMPNGHMTQFELTSISSE